MTMTPIHRWLHLGVSLGSFAFVVTLIACDGESVGVEGSVGAGATSGSVQHGLQCDQGVPGDASSSECGSCKLCASSGTCAAQATDFDTHPSSSAWMACVYGSTGGGAGCLRGTGGLPRK